MKKMLLKFGGILAALALFAGGTSTYFLSPYFYYQPKEPKALRDLRNARKH